MRNLSRWPSSLRDVCSTQPSALTGQCCHFSSTTVHIPTGEYLHKRVVQNLDPMFLVLVHQKVLISEPGVAVSGTEYKCQLRRTRCVKAVLVETGEHEATRLCYYKHYQLHWDDKRYMERILY